MSSLDYWILDENGEPKPVKLMEWTAWFENNRTSRIVKQETVGSVYVSTVFLGLDHSLSFDEDESVREPLLWETMVFRANPSKEERGQDFDMERCGGKKEKALRMHHDMVAKWKSHEEQLGAEISGLLGEKKD